jgi:hypothetical protein
MQNNVGIYASSISGNLFAPGGAYDALATATVGAGGTYSVSFVGIPNSYKHLQIRAVMRCATGGTGDSFTEIQFNGDTAANYSTHIVYAGAPNATSWTSSNYVYMYNLPLLGNNAFAGSIIDILDYASTTKAKTLKYISGWDSNSSGDMQLGSGLWYKTPEAINSITLNSITPGNLFAENTQFALYGIK